MPWRCPKCPPPDTDWSGFVHAQLEVSVRTWAYLRQYKGGEFETDAFDAKDGSHEWDGSSTMRCMACGHTGPASEFEVKSVSGAEEPEA